MLSRTFPSVAVESHTYTINFSRRTFYELRNDARCFAQIVYASSRRSFGGRHFASSFWVATDRGTGSKSTGAPAWHARDAAALARYGDHQCKRESPGAGAVRFDGDM